MQLPAWANKVVSFLVLAAVVLAARGVGRLFRRFVPGTRGIVAAVLVGAGIGFGAGAGLAMWWFPPQTHHLFVPFIGGFCALVGAIQAGLSAGGVDGPAKISAGD